MIYFGTDDYYLHVIDPQEGTAKKIIKIGDASKLGGGFRLVIGKDGILYIASGDVVCLTPEGDIKW